MATFFVGQRVRIINAEISKFLIGTEARVIDPDVIGVHFGGTYRGVKTDAINAQGRPFIAEHWWLEPILPDGHRAGDYSLSELLDRCRAGDWVAA